MSKVLEEFKNDLEHYIRTKDDKNMYKYTISILVKDDTINGFKGLRLKRVDDASKGIDVKISKLDIFKDEKFKTVVFYNTNKISLLEKDKRLITNDELFGRYEIIDVSDSINTVELINSFLKEYLSSLFNSQEGRDD